MAGLHPERTRLVFGFLTATVIAVAIKIVGVLLIVALLVIPPATARRFAASPEQMAAFAAGAGVLAIVVAALLLFAVTRFRRPGALPRHPLKAPRQDPRNRRESVESQDSRGVSQLES